MITILNLQPELSLFIIITLGYLLGRIRVFGFSLESSGILFVALGAGYLGVHLPVVLKSLGLILFIYAVGLQAGPRFLNLFRNNGIFLNILAFVIVSSAAILIVIGKEILQIPTELAVGIFSGALTSTPGLAAAQEATQSPLTSVGYGVSYPFGVIAVILFLRIFQIRHKDREALPESEPKLNKDTKMALCHIEIKNRAIYGQKLKSLCIRSNTGATVARIQREGNVLIPNQETTLEKGDLIRCVGPKEGLRQVSLMLGPLTHKRVRRQTIDVHRFVVTNKKLVGTTIGQLNLSVHYNANITRIRRSGLDFPAVSSQKLEWGDRVIVVSEKTSIPELKKLFGDDLSLLETANIYTIVAGLLIGILSGMIPFTLGQLISLKMGITGGVLLSALVLSAKGRLGPIVWRVPYPIIHFMRELGLVLFLSVVGTSSGSAIVPIISRHGISLILFTIIVAMVPMCLAAFIGVRFFKLKLLSMTGVIAGGMTSTPGLGVATGYSDSTVPTAVYASVYPLAMIFMIVWTKILAIL